MLADGRAPGFRFDKSRPRLNVGWRMARPLSSWRRPPLKHEPLAGPPGIAMSPGIDSMPAESTGFWQVSPYGAETYTDEQPSPELVHEIQRSLGFRLPAAYITLMMDQNGGIPVRRNHRTDQPTSWADDHVALAGFFSIGFRKRCSLCGETGSAFWIREWGYPAIGVYFADTPSAGHDMLCLDYRGCGPDGEPTVVHVDQERGFKITPVAESFSAFVRGLEPDDVFEAG